MVAASEKVPQLMREKDSHQSEGERKSSGESPRIFVKQRERPQQFVDRHSLIVSISDRELRARDQASAEREQKQSHCEDQGSH